MDKELTIAFACHRAAEKDDAAAGPMPTSSGLPE
jgi:hypothetical protein